MTATTRIDGFTIRNGFSEGGGGGVFCAGGGVVRQGICQPSFDPRCYLNHDGRVDIVDLLYLADNWGL